MNFRYRTHQLLEIVQADKMVREGQSLEFMNYKDQGKHLELDLDLRAGALVNLRFVIIAGRFNEPETYRAALLLDGQRIRGVDYSAIETKQFYRVVAPKGWHQNVIDPNLPTREINRHVPLPDFNATDLNDFLVKVAQMWHIELPIERVLL